MLLKLCKIFFQNHKTTRRILKYIFKKSYFNKEDRNNFYIVLATSRKK